MLDAAAVRAAAAAQELVEADEALHRLFQRGRYVRHSDMVVSPQEAGVGGTTNAAGSSVGIYRDLARDALGKACVSASNPPRASTRSARTSISGSCQASVPAVAAAADAAMRVPG